MSSRRPHAPHARPAVEGGSSTRGRSRPATRAGGSAPSRPERRPRAPRPSSGSDERRPPRAITVRALILGLVVLVAFVVLTPTLRAFVTQSEQKRGIDAEYAAVLADVEALEGALARWDDPAFVKAQARERLSFVMPGEVAYRVIDPQSVEPDDADSPYVGLVAPEDRGPEVPWYLTVWDSVLESGEESGDGGAPAPGGLGSAP